MVTDSELARAIRAIGADGEPFSGAALRAHLGITTEDRRTLTHFNAVLRAYCKAHESSLEQVGKNRYRLLDAALDRDPECEPEASEAPRLRRIVIRITRTPAEAEPEPRGWLSAFFARLGLSSSERPA